MIICVAIFLLFLFVSTIEYVFVSSDINIFAATLFIFIQFCSSVFLFSVCGVLYIRFIDWIVEKAWK